MVHQRRIRNERADQRCWRSAMHEPRAGSAILASARTDPIGKVPPTPIAARSGSAALMESLTRRGGERDCRRPGPGMSRLLRARAVGSAVSHTSQRRIASGVGASRAAGNPVLATVATAVRVAVLEGRAKQ
jgi:hypothetical protein